MKTIEPQTMAKIIQPFAAPCTMRIPQGGSGSTADGIDASAPCYGCAENVGVLAKEFYGSGRRKFERDAATYPLPGAGDKCRFIL